MKLSIVAAVAALSTFGIASSAMAQCGPNLNFNVNTSDMMNHGETDNLNFGNGAGLLGEQLGIQDGKSESLTLGLTLSFNLDGGRGCKEQDLRIAAQQDQILRASRQAFLQEQQQSQAFIQNLVASIQYCEAADLDIPANASFCTDYIKD